MNKQKEIRKIHYNWFQSYDGNNAGEDFDHHTVGQRGVIEILEYPAYAEGDKWYYDVIFENGDVERIFNINRVFFKELKTKP
jgi:hypothetical protein